MKVTKYYINHQYTDLDYFGKKEKDAPDTWGVYDSIETAREAIREFIWKYNREVYDERTGEFFRVHNFWISKRATKKYYSNS